jgi:hypothetical protein
MTHQPRALKRETISPAGRGPETSFVVPIVDEGA